MVRQTLFQAGIPKWAEVLRMEGEEPNRDSATRNYERMLLESVDILFLSVGLD